MNIVKYKNNQSLEEKIQILSDSAKYDVSCSSSGSNRQNKGGLGNAHVSGICHSWTSDGRCVSLLKILMTNKCIYDCSYCINRSSNTDIKRAIFDVQEIVDLTINFYRRNYIEGLFLSSGVYKSPNYTMELLYQVAYKLREEENFNGYIHMKAIPGADKLLIDKVASLVDRMSVNIELPSEESLKKLAPQKDRQSIFLPMYHMKNHTLMISDEKKRFKHAPSYIPAGQTTQMIIGASNESDLSILKLTEALYDKVMLKRVYFSAYIPVNEGSNLPAITSAPPLKRENRLYQADWLLRFYGFRADEILNEKNPFFDLELDPKSNWALNNLHLFPVEINSCSYEMLLKIPGIGVICAKRIIRARKYASVSFETLKKLGAVVKRAKYFITCRGKFYGDIKMDEISIRQNIKPKAKKESPYEQLTFDSFINVV
ncbi:putative DNA modification/repair radical SAM protein [Peptostreptococcaceae bacterium AS15]|nr:putative DNA modification/repair radical SAM protein [[Eubacterium] yurii subsp. margaretiae ATCC 43715]EJP23351.1 putative DNA modification/repair radical SAM protein [Peptostreptococcaceae bacterium AS15]